MANRPTSKTESITILNLKQQLKEAHTIILKLQNKIKELEAQIK